jgi:hypothetical protein
VEAKLCPTAKLIAATACRTGLPVDTGPSHPAWDEQLAGALISGGIQQKEQYEIQKKEQNEIQQKEQ